MRTLYRTHLQIDAQIDEVATCIHDWALTLPEVTEGDLDTWQGTDGARSAWRLRFASSGDWRIEAQLAQDSDELHAAARVMSADSTKRTRLALTARLIERFSCRRDGQVCSNRAIQVDEASLASFVSQVFTHPQRSLPIIALSRNHHESVALDPDELQTKAAGIALVAVWDSDMSRSLVQQFGRQFACYGGAVRVYRPNPQPTDPRGHHRFFLWSDAGAPGFERQLLDLAADTALAADPPSEIDAIIQSVRSAAQMSAAPANALRELGTENEVLKQDLEQSQAEAAQLRRNLNVMQAAHDASQAEVADLTRQLDQVVAYLASERGDSPPPPTLAQQPQSVLEAVQLAYEQLEHLDIFQNATDEAQRSHYQPADKVLAGLGTLNTVAGLLLSGSTTDEQIVQALKERGLEVSGESADTMHRYGDQRLFRNEFGHLIEMQLHLKFGAGSGADALCRVYFRWSTTSGRMEIGHVGRHLQTSDG